MEISAIFSINFTKVLANPEKTQTAVLMIVPSRYNLPMAMADVTLEKVRLHVRMIVWLKGSVAMEH